MGLNKVVEFSAAKLLKEKGFDNLSEWAYQSGKLVHDSRNKEHKNWNKEKHVDCSAPTIAEVVMWLYEKYGIWISVSITIQKEYYYQCIDTTGKKDSTKNNYPSRICKPGNYYYSPIEAYKAAIAYTLNNLI